MRLQTRATGLLLFIALLALAPSTSTARERATVVVLATTDVHAQIYPYDYYTARPANRGLAKISTLVSEARRANPGALLLDCGDTIQGTPLAFIHQRQARARVRASPPNPIVAAMNQMGYDAMAVGNHEFNFGLDALWKAAHQARFPWLSANVVPAATAQEVLALKKRRYESAAEQMGERTFEPMVVREVNGVRVAIIGLTTPVVPNWESPEHIEGYRFEAPAEAARFWIRHAREVRRAEIVILAAHTGLERDPGDGRPLPGGLPGENAVYELATGVPGVDAIVFGHSHRELPQATLNGVLLVQPRNWGQSLAEITFVVERDIPSAPWNVTEKRSRTIPVTDATEPDRAVLALARLTHQAAERWLERPVTRSPAVIEATLGRVADTAAVDLVHRVQLAAAKADVSLAASLNPGAVIPRGRVTVRHLAALYPYENTLVCVELTGRALKEALEYSARFYARYTGDPGPLFNPEVLGFNYETAAGVTYKIDVSQPEGERIVDLRFRGEPIDMDRKFRVAISSYRKAGGGAYGMLRGARVLWESDEDVRQLMIDYYSGRKYLPAKPDNNWEVVPAAAREALVAAVSGKR